jgi:hypothetical protein
MNLILYSICGIETCLLQNPGLYRATFECFNTCYIFRRPIDILDQGYITCLHVHVTITGLVKTQVRADDAHKKILGPFAEFVDSPSYSQSELCGGAVTVSFSKYLPWQAIHFL